MIDFIGWTLIHAVWQGGIIASAIAAAFWLARRSTPSARYFIGVVGLALTVVAPITTTFVKGYSVVERSGPTHASPPALPIMTATGGEVVQEKTIAATGSSMVTRRVADRVDSALPWLVAAWLLGIGLLSLRVLSGVVHVRSLGRRGISTVDARIRAVARLVAARLGIRSAVNVLQSTRVDVPMVVGWLKPVVLVPVGLLAGITPAQLEMLLAHELAHIRRYDTIVNFAQTIVETLLFFHPAVWWMSARIHEERENCCDDLAIMASASDRHAYGRMLLLLEESRDTNIALAAAATDGSLLRRVRRVVLGPPSRVELGPSWLAGVATLLTVVLVATAAPRQPPSTGQPPSRSTPMPISPRSLLVGATAITMAGKLSAQLAPDVSGRWMLVEQSTVEAGFSKVEALPPMDERLCMIEQTARTLTFIRESFRMTFLVEVTDPIKVRAKGPIATSFNVRGVDVSLTTAVDTPRFHAKWEGGRVDIDVSKKLSAVFATMTASLDSAGDLIVETEVPQPDGQPVKRSVQRFRRV